MKNPILLCLLLFAQLTAAANPQSAFLPTNLHDSVPYQGNPLLENPVMLNSQVGDKAYLDCDWETLLSMVRDLEERIATALEVDTVYNVYYTSEAVGSGRYLQYDCVVLRDSIISLQMQLDDVLLGPPTVLSQEVLSIAQHVATIKAKITDDGGAPLRLWGVLFGKHTWWNDTLGFFDADSLNISSLNDYTTLLDSTLATRWDALQDDWDTYTAGDQLPEPVVMDTASLFVDSVFMATIKGLERFTEYIAVPIAANDSLFAELMEPSNFARSELNVGPFGWYGMGDTIMFRTLPDKASGFTLDTANVLQNSALLKFTLNDAGGQGPDAAGFFYDTLSFTTASFAGDSIFSDSIGGTTHTAELTGLTRYTDYYFRAFADNLAGRGHSETSLMFRTLPDIPTFDSVYFDTGSDSLVAILSDDGGQAPTAQLFRIADGSDLISAVDSSALLVGDAFRVLYSGDAGSTYFTSAVAQNLAGTAYSDTIEWSTLAEITTNTEVREKTDSSGTIQASVLFGNAVPTAVGFQWGLAADLSDATDSIISLAADSTFELALTGLTKYNTYYFSSFATNSGGTANGDTLNFTARTLVCEPPNFDGYDYDVVVIGNQCWFAENLRNDNYNDGTAITGGLNSADWASATSGAQAVYEADSVTYLSDYGRVYNFHAVNTGLLCPVGWHVPTHDEFTELSSYLGGTAVAGVAMKSSSADVPSWNGTNSSGFAALPGSFRHEDGTFSPAGIAGYWWTSSDSATYARYWNLNTQTSTAPIVADNTLYSGLFNQVTGNSVRCVRDGDSSPVVTTAPVEATNATTAHLQGSVAFNWEPIKASGFKWGYQADLSDGVEVTGDTLSGDFARTLNGLAPEAAVYYVAFATNDLGTTYGDTLAFNTKVQLTDANIGNAAEAWCADSLSATSTYGHISDWEMGAVTNINRIFKNQPEFNSDISQWDVSAVTTAFETFSGATAFDQNLSNWDVSSLQNMGGMFNDASSFSSDLSTWDVSSVTNMKTAFKGCTALGTDFSGWDVSSVKDISYMFDGAANFSSDLSAWDVSSVTDMKKTFANAGGFQSDLSAWDVSSVTSMEMMFMGAELFDADLNGWNVTSVNNMRWMFSEALNFNGPISNWDVGSVTDMEFMFQSASSFDQALNTWDVSSVNTMQSMFSDASSFNQDLSGWDVSSVTNMSDMFKLASTFDQELNNWNVGQVETMKGMFQNATAFNRNLSGWDVSSVTNMQSMFSSAVSFDQNLNTWDVSGVENMSFMFNSANSFNGDVSSWNVSNVNNMAALFKGASAFNGDVSAWDVSSVTIFRDMFNMAIAFNSAVSPWNVSSGGTMYSMFKNATAFNQSVSDWDVSSVTNMDDLFEGAVSFNQDLSSWNVAAVTAMNGLISGTNFSQTNYDALLMAWSALPLQSNVSLYAMDRSYCYGAAARQSIIDDYGWTISGDTPCSPLPSATAEAATNVGLNAADLNGSFEGMSVVSEAGFIYGTDSTLAGAVQQVAGTTSPFTLSLSGLAPNTKYYYRAYVTDEIATIEGLTTESFQTFSFPEVTTILDSTWTDSTATLIGWVDPNVLPAATVTGFKWGALADLSDATDVAGDALADTFTYALTATGPLYYTAYATNAVGTVYGDTLQLVDTSVLSTSTASHVANASATLNASLYSGRRAITATGFNWGYQSDLSDATAVAGDSLLGDFSAELNGLVDGSTIYFSAFMTDEMGTVHGDTLSQCLMICEPAAFEGYTYETVSIGCQCWFAENLRTASYRDGTPIAAVLVDTAWSTTLEGAHVTYDGDSTTYYADYGRLYNWYAVDSAAGLCPTGWHVPTDGEFTVLSDFLGGASLAGEKLKASATDIPAWDGTNSTGWSGLPGGARNSSGYFAFAGANGSWWSSSMSDSLSWSHHLFGGQPNFMRYSSNRRDGNSVRCLRDGSSAPQVSTGAALDVLETTATLSGTLDFDGWKDITATGFEWGYETDLSDGTVVAADSLAGEFSTNLSGLVTGDTLYFAAFATNVLGTSYGDTLSFKVTAPPCRHLSSVNFDGHDYSILEIGNQCWFAENLRTTVFSNGDNIDDGLTNSAWSNSTSSARTVYGEGGSSAAANLSQYGRLYNWYAVADERGICPEGWHAPSNEEWTILVDGYGGTASAGNELKAASTDSPAWDGDNLSGFTALPGGYRNDNDGLFNQEGNRAYMWTTSEAGGQGKRWRIDGGSDVLVPADNPKQNGFSVRCLMDTASAPAVVTLPATQVAASSGTLVGSVTFNWSPISATGFKWSQSPDLSNATDVAGYTLVSTFESPLSGLSLGDEIYFSAYATNALGTTFGDTLSFITTSCVSPEMDGYTYSVVEVADQCWFAENLRTTTYLNGDPIPSNLSNSAWSSTTSGAVTVYGQGTSSAESNLSTYGRLYNHYAVTDSRGICPVNWHTPTNAEWTTLVNTFGGTSSASNELKASSADSPGWDGNNLSGFTVLPGGYRNNDNGLFDRENERAYMWTSATAGSLGKRWRLDQNSDALVPSDNGMRNGFSVRCIQNPATVPVVSTANHTSGSSTEVTLNGSVAVNTAVNSATGFKWWRITNPSEVFTVSSESLEGTFSATINDLITGTRIYFTAFATNDLGTSYGDTLFYTPQAELCTSPTFDGYAYEVVTIGDQCWFAENLRTTTYANGAAIATSGGFTISSEPIGAQTIYDNDSLVNYLPYGRLYNGWAAIDAQNVCPTGWHVPNESDWNTFEIFAGLPSNLVDSADFRGNHGAGLKALPGSVPAWDGSDAFGFNGVPGGMNVSGGFAQKESVGAYLSSTPLAGDASNYRMLSTDSTGVGLYALPSFTGASIRCIQDTATLPVVITAPAVDRNRFGGEIGANIAFNWSPITASGFLLSSQADLSSATDLPVGVSVGDFSATINSLVLGDTLYYAAYATNELGTSYGDTLSLGTTLCESPEFDGYKYAVVEIGDQCWFAENLRSDSYADGTPITGGMDDATWEATTEGAQAIYGNDSLTYYADYGRLYNWYAVDSAAGLCPTGWHVPTDVEFTTLADFLGPYAGEKMKSSNTDTPPWNGTNSSVWSGLPGGNRSQSGEFFNTDNYGFWWSSMPSGSDAFYRRLSGNNQFFLSFTASLQNGYSIRCLQDEASLPQVSTAPASAVTQTTAMLNGTLDFDGWETITATGFKWGYQPDLSDGIEAAGDTLAGEFSADLTGLAENSTIYFSAFATNALGTVYGDTLSRCLITCNPVEFDGYTYETVAIGCQCWFAENLRSDNYADGTPIAGGLDNATWSVTTEGAQAIYGNDSLTYYADYGRLYNWYAVDSTAGLCPTGWHVPTDDEWKTLEMELGMTQIQANALSFRGTNQGTQMKATSGWISPGNASNSSGFTGLPGGNRSDATGSFYKAGDSGYWWSSSPNGSAAWFRVLGSANEGVARGANGQRIGRSVRCLRDEASLPQVSTAPASAVTQTTAMLNGTLDFDGWETITATGFKWGYQPDLSDGIEVAGDTLAGEFSADLTGLTEVSTIYFSAFATNEVGTTYGDTLSRCLIQCDPVEFDGYTYETVAIGCQCWFAENLRSDNYADGSPIPGGLDRSTWSGRTEGAQAIYDSDSAAYFADYGRLYNWYAVESAAGVCPTGWHVPTDAEILTLADFLGGQTVAGIKMKSSPSDSPSWDGTNSSGWSGLPSGYRASNGDFFNASSRGRWWSSSTSDSFAVYRALNSDAQGFGSLNYDYRGGFSVRCLKDSD